MKTFLSEAFKALDLLEEENFDISNSDEMDKLKLFIDDDVDDDDDTISIIDMDATDEEELEDSYDGKIICDCPVCHSKVFKNKEDIVLNDESDLANVGEECPYCYSVDGFKIIGEVAPFHKDYDATAEDKDGNPVDVELSVEDEEDKAKTESFRRRRGRKSRLNESVTFIDYKPGSGALANLKKQLKENGKKYVLIDARNMDPEDIGGAVTERNGNAVKIPSNIDFSKYDAIIVDSYDSASKDLKRELDNTGLEIYAITYSRKPKNEALEKLDLETENDLIHVTAETKDEQIVPIDMDTQSEIEMEQPLDDDDLDIDVESDEEDTDMDMEDEEGGEDEELPNEAEVDEFDEESFDELGEAYLKQVYNNVRGFRTRSIKESNNSIIVEGVINFKSGNNKLTTFKFTPRPISGRNTVRLLGENFNIASGRNSFSLTGKVKGRKFITEKFTYNYINKDSNGNRFRVHGSIKR